jgi:hypothetical protein
MIENIYWSSCKVPVILCPVLMELEFSPHITKNTQVSNFMKLCPVEAESFHMDRWSDMMKLAVTLCNFANVPKNG